MSEYIKIALKVIWLIVLTYWFILGFTTKKVKSQESFLKRFLFYWLPLVIAGLLLGPTEWYMNMLISENFVEHTNFVGTIGLTFCIFGASIACWSRYKLGRNWSLSVQKKENHELIQSGFYKIVRHPIYTGFLFLFIGNTIIVGDYRGIISVLIVFVSFWFKLAKEEKLLIENFGNQYVEYKKRTKALIPYIL